MALATGLHRTQGWGLALMAGPAAAFADWDGLSILFGGEAYSRVHRVWGHNLFATVFLGGAFGAMGYLALLSSRFRRYSIHLPGETQPAFPPPYSHHNLACWVLVGVLAGASHLPADMVFSGHKEMTVWPVQAFWPLSSQGYVLPLVSWGDMTATILFIGAMFALYRWPGKSQGIAILALVGLHVYIGICWWNGGIGR